MNLGVSIILCTYNGGSNLPKTLAHLAEQKTLENIRWEVIFCDNNSTDNSTEIAIDFWERKGLNDVPLVTLKENKPGKLFAQQTAIKKANYEYLIICDDDNWLADNYVETVFYRLNENLDIAAIGGFGSAVYDGGKLPNWFSDYQYGYAVGPQASETGYLKKAAFLWGAGLATRKALYNTMYEKFPSLLLDANGINISFAEDTEYCLRLLLKNYKLFYDEDLIYQHYITQNRLTELYRDERLKYYRTADVVIKKYQAALRVKRKTNKGLFSVFGAIIFALVQKYFGFKKIERSLASDTLFYFNKRQHEQSTIRGKIKEFFTH